MAEWYYGYADEQGLQDLKKDPESITVELFYDSEVKQEISDDKTVDLWKMVNRAFNNKSSKGVLFRALLADGKEYTEVMDLMSKNPKEALVLLDTKTTGIEVNVNGTTRETAEFNWNTITGRTPVALQKAEEV